MAVRPLPLFGADITLCSILFCEMKIKFSIYAQNLKLHIMFDDVHWWFMFSNYRFTVALCLPYWRVRSAIFTKLRLLALPCLFVRLYVSTPEPLLKSSWAVSYVSAELKNQRFGGLLRLYHQDTWGEWPRVTDTYIPVNITWKTTFISVLERRTFFRHKV